MPGEIKSKKEMNGLLSGFCVGSCGSDGMVTGGLSAFSSVSTTGLLILHDISMHTIINKKKILVFFIVQLFLLFKID